MRKYRLYLFIISVLFMTFTAMGRDFTVVIDAGHGGHDYGAVGNITNEKSINLAVALKLGKLIEKNCKNVKVVYTRSTDKFIALNDRAKIANQAKGDLFISIHVNSVDRKSKNRNTVAGAEVYTIGLHKTDENLAVAKRENAVMALEADFTETYKGFDPNSVESYIIFELSQSRHIDDSINFAAAAEDELVNTAGRARKGVKQAGFWVLWATSMPAVLVELDFICNPRSEQFLHSENGQNKLATSLYNAFSQYLASRPGATETPRIIIPDATTPSDSPAQSDSQSIASAKPQQLTTTDNNELYQPDADHYRIQIMAHDTELGLDSKQFKGERVESYSENNLYKYTVGRFKSKADAQSELSRIKRQFPQAFIIRMHGDTRQY